MATPTEGWGTSRRATVIAWIVFAAVSAFAASQVLLADFRDQPVIGDAASYLLQAESLGYAGHDLAYDQRDLDYYRGFEWSADPYGLYFQRNDDGWAFAKPYGYSVVLAPFLRAFGPRHGVALANLSLLAALGMVGAATLRLRYRGAVVPLVLGVFLFGSPLVFYAFHVWVEVFVATLVAATFYALVRAARDRSLPWTLAGMACTGLLLAEKAPALPLVLPIVIVAVAALPGWRPRLAALGVGCAVLLLASIPYVRASDGQTWNPYGGERYYAKSGVPFGDAPTTGSFHRVTSDETFSIGYARREAVRDLDDKAASAAYYVIGRHTGLLVFTPLALFVLVASLLGIRRADRIGLAVLLGVIGYIGFYVVLFPHNYNGGGQTFGNRYFVQIYPVALVLPVVAKLRVRLLAGGAAASGALALAFMWPHYRDARHALRDLQTTNRLQQLLPFEANQDGADYFRCGISACPDDGG